MLEHVATMLGTDVEEVRHHFPTPRSLLPIDIPPPRPLTPNVAIPSSPTLQYPGTELEHYVDPSYPNSPPSVTPSPPADSSPSPQLRRGSPRVPLADITPIRQVSHPLGDTTDYEELAMVLYRQVSDQDAKIKELLEADKENQTPSPTDPQPSTHPSPGWEDNFTATGTRHLFVIPLGDEDVVAPFIRYDLRSPFPELLATNGRYCTIHSCPLHAVPQTLCSSPLSPCNELFFHPNLELTSGVDWAILHKNDPTLAGEVRYFRSHKKACNRLAKRMGQLWELLEIERQALYRSSARLTGANALGRLQCHIDSSLHITSSFSTTRVKKICTSICNRVTEECVRHPKECMWCRKVGHTIDNCFCIGLCCHCSRRGHTGVDCKDPHSMCLEYGDCKVYPTHPHFKRGYCAAIDDCVDV